MNRQEKRSVERKVTKATKLKSVKTEQKEIPKELKDMFGAVRGSSIVFHLLQEGSFNYKYQNQLQIALKFMEELYTETLYKAIAHPDAEMIPELKLAIETKKAEATSGEKTQN